VVTVIDPRVALGLEAIHAAATRAGDHAGRGPSLRHSGSIRSKMSRPSISCRCHRVSSLIRPGGFAGCGIVERESAPILVVDLRALVPGLNGATRHEQYPIFYAAPAKLTRRLRLSGKSVRWRMKTRL